jgi:hypothetical protein
VSVDTEPNGRSKDDLLECIELCNVRLGLSKKALYSESLRGMCARKEITGIQLLDYEARFNEELRRLKAELKRRFPFRGKRRRKEDDESLSTADIAPTLWTQVRRDGEGGYKMKANGEWLSVSRDFVKTMPRVQWVP